MSADDTVSSGHYTETAMTDSPPAFFATCLTCGWQGQRRWALSIAEDDGDQHRSAPGVRYAASTGSPSRG